MCTNPIWIRLARKQQHMCAMQGPPAQETTAPVRQPQEAVPPTPPRGHGSADLVDVDTEPPWNPPTSRVGGCTLTFRGQWSRTRQCCSAGPTR